ncbi:hypothetical protein E2C01_092588 [Portunus trituberculatus]|uniref:Uncharacterized protein n=1 Tax=Portunus trituberculatus TaxID=210409 RepID=A0A5B7JS56_PORTR|nr:hypothetical protein [Portunus trituberculatus]
MLHHANQSQATTSTVKHRTLYPTPDTTVTLVLRFDWLRQLRCQGSGAHRSTPTRGTQWRVMAGNARQRNTSLVTSFTESSVHSTSQGSLHTHTHRALRGVPRGGHNRPQQQVARLNKQRVRLPVLPRTCSLADSLPSAARQPNTHKVSLRKTHIRTHS